ncbi:MAG: ArsR family transcriptional regulator [Planctomycetota bacterium]
MGKSIPHPELEGVTIDDALKALADPVRREIVRLASTQDELPCNAFTSKIPKSTMSYHWRVLRESGLIRQTSAGTQRLNTLRREEFAARFPGLLEAVLASIERDTGPIESGHARVNGVRAGAA